MIQRSRSHRPVSIIYTYRGSRFTIELQATATVDCLLTSVAYVKGVSRGRLTVTREGPELYLEEPVSPNVEYQISVID